MRLRDGLIAFACCAGLLAAAPAAASAGSGTSPSVGSNCAASVPYPGDSAAKSSIAGWMGARAVAAGLPAELPVMAGLTESSLTNIDDPRSGYAGFFQMSRDIFSTGQYAGFPDKPELQIKWFTDTAVAVRAKRIAAGRPDPTGDDSSWGIWIADVEKPAEQYRSRYQLHLEEARDLLGPGCTATPPPPTSPTGDGEALSLWGGTQQKLGRKVRVAVLCPTGCDASATGSLRFRDSGTSYDLQAASASGVAGDKVKLTLTVPTDAAKAARKAVRRGEKVRARIDVTAVDASGAEASARRNVRLG